MRWCCANGNYTAENGRQVLYFGHYTGLWDTQTDVK